MKAFVSYAHESAKCYGTYSEVYGEAEVLLVKSMFFCIAWHFVQNPFYYKRTRLLKANGNAN